MIIHSFKLRNFKSFGNNVTEVKLNPTTGELILLLGKNGAGKSSILEGVDFSIYGKVRGKKKSFIRMDSLPNRYNRSLVNEIEFSTAEHFLSIKRSVSPSKLELSINGVPYDRAGKANVQSKIEEIVGIDIDTFKSFISMSINDFKNFMVLTPEEKRMLLDRLFNLEMVNKLAGIIKEKKKQVAHASSLCQTEINSFESSLQTFRGSVAKLKASALRNIAEEREQLKETLLSKRGEYDELKVKLDKAAENEGVIQTRIAGIREQHNEARYQIADSQKKINLYDLGKCPTCSFDLAADESYEAVRQGMREVHIQLVTLEQTLRAELQTWEANYTKFKGVLAQRNAAFTEMRVYLTQVKARLTGLAETEEDAAVNESIAEITKSMDKIEKRKEASGEKLAVVQESGMVIDHLSKLFSEEGIKKNIIAKIVVPLNHFIKESIGKLGLPFHVELDDQFTARITLMGEEIDAETLSTGETKLCNIAIMLAYLRMIRTKKHINLLFLDEVFSSIDVQNIYLVLELLKDFAREYNINIFLIHHAMLEKSYFDRIMRVEKNMTSYITEE